MNIFVSAQYLHGLSPVVRHNFLRCLHPPRPSDDNAVDLAWLTKFMGLAVLFTRPGEVQSKLYDQPWRDIEWA